jgi:hypothetical protein
MKQMLDDVATMSSRPALALMSVVTTGLWISAAQLAFVGGTEVPPYVRGAGGPNFSSGDLTACPWQWATGSDG